MHQDYKDILSRISEEPKWFDENGTPRFCDFEPGRQSKFYAYEVALLEIECQSCGKKFKVCLSRDLEGDTDYLLSTGRGYKRFPNIPHYMLHYGDPPNVGCCDAGPTMNSIPLKFLEYWSFDSTKWEPITWGGWEKVLENKSLDEIEEDNKNIEFQIGVEGEILELLDKSLEIIEVSRYAISHHEAKNLHDVLGELRRLHIAEHAKDNQD